MVYVRCFMPVAAGSTAALNQMPVRQVKAVLGSGRLYGGSHLNFLTGLNDTGQVGQQDLFSTPPHALLPGLRYQPDFLDAHCEQRLLEHIRRLPLREAQYKEYRAKRRVAHFGRKYDFSRQELESAEPMAAFLTPLRDLVGAWAGVDPAELDQALIAEYQPGTQLGWHRDVPQFETVIGVSLLGHCRMRFRPYPPLRGAKVFDMQVAPRSAYILQEAARWEWQHSLAPTPALRYSVTFRTVRSG
jgi:alkylated DNA repair dioxygenase AlkB